MIILLIQLQSILGGNNDCVLEDGFTWCETSKKCARDWEEPCLPVTKECALCLAQNYYGGGDSCGNGCSISIIENMENAGFLGTDENGCSIDGGTIWCPSLNRCISPLRELCREIAVDPSPLCHNIRCAMYCDNGFQKDMNGCDICACNTNENSLPNTCKLEGQGCPYDYVCPKVREITHCSQGGIEGYTTYELSLMLKPNTDADNIYALFGDTDEGPLSHGTTMHIPAAFNIHNDVFNSDFGGVPEDLINFHPDSRFDSWLTIGITDGDPEHKVSSIGIDFNSWNDDQSLDITNGAIFLMDPQQKVVKGNEYVIAHLTLRNEDVQGMSINVQGEKKHVETDGTWMERDVVFHLSSPTPLEDNIPHNCITWFDGCNTCTVTNGIKGSCTRRKCSSTKDPHCLSSSSGH